MTILKELTPTEAGYLNALYDSDQSSPWRPPLFFTLFENTRDLARVINRTYDVLVRQGLLRRIPEIVRGDPFLSGEEAPEIGIAEGPELTQFAEDFIEACRAPKPASEF